MKFYIAILIFILINGCDTQTADDCVCTAVFAGVGVKVYNQNHQPAILDSTIVKNKSTGKVYTFYNQIAPGGEYYTVMDDTYVNEFETIPEVIIFTGIKDTSKVTGEFLINTDECKCHINKVAGPDTLIINL